MPVSVDNGAGLMTNHPRRDAGSGYRTLASRRKIPWERALQGDFASAREREGPRLGRVQRENLVPVSCSDSSHSAAAVLVSRAARLRPTGWVRPT